MSFSELAKWNTGRPSSRDPYHSPLDAPRPPAKISEQKRAQHRFNAEHSQADSPAHARPSGLYTTPTSSHDIHRSRQPATVHTTPNSASHPSRFIAPSPNASVHVSRVHSSQPVSSSKSISLSKPVSTMHSEVIDLTLEDTEDELDTLVSTHSKKANNHDVVPGPSRRTASSRPSSPIAPEESLFTPPPPRRRARLFIDHLAVPPFPKGLSKADYQPMFRCSAVPLPSPTVTGPVGDSPLAASPVAMQERTPEKRKGKEREHDVVSASKKYKRPIPAAEGDVFSSAFLDALEEHAMIPLYDDDTYPPLTSLDLLANSRFQFANAWREHASRLREAELDWTQGFRLLGKACVWARSASTPSPRLPGSAGYVSINHPRPWKLVTPESTQDEGTIYDLAFAEDHVSCPSLPDDSMPGPSTAVDPVPSGSILPQGSTVGDMAHDMNQYFNGLGDSPAKHAPPRQELAPTHPFRPHLLQSAGHAEMDSLGFGFPSLGLDPRLTDAGDHECFLGVPPSPPADVGSPTVSGPITDPPSQSVDYFSPSPSNIFDASPVDAWSSFEQGASLLPEDHSPSNNDVAPTAADTIDPSLLGLEQSQEQPRPQVPKDSTPKRRSKLPEPVIYMRRPIDSSSLPLLSGKRPVQIKYRDSAGSPPTPPTRTPSNAAKNSKQPSSDTDDHERTKRRSVPSRKLREHSASESDADYIPEPPTLKIKLKLKRPSLAAKESAIEDQDTEREAAPAMSYCHQCRNRSARPKMACSNVVQGRVCGKRFCNRCILHRYPDVTFDAHSAGFLCPVCTHTCNCSFCSRNRGEEFISMRLGGLAASLFKTKVTLVRDGRPRPRTQSLPPRRNAGASAATTPTPEPSASSVQPQFWAHVYGMEGERVGSAFMTREQMTRLQTDGGGPTRSTTKTRGAPRGPRVFVGRPLAAWGLRGVRDLEPGGAGVDVKDGATDAETGVGRRRRCYVGDRALLYAPYGRMPGLTTRTGSRASSRRSTPALGSDGNLTPLSDGEGVELYWPQPDVGECCAWAPPPPPLDTARASGSLERASVDVDGPPGGLDLNVGVAMDVDVGDEPTSASTVLSEEDMARAISAALAAIHVESS